MPNFSLKRRADVRPHSEHAVHRTRAAKCKACEQSHFAVFTYTIISQRFNCMFTKRDFLIASVATTALLASPIGATEKLDTRKTGHPSNERESGHSLNNQRS